MTTVWIKDEIKNEIYIINGATKNDPFLGCFHIKV